MITHEIQRRPHYGWVDQMGYLYHAHYVDYFDMGRTELMRSFGMPYAEIERRGVMMPVVDLAIRYRTPSHYDELLTIRTSVREMPTAKITFWYEVIGQDGTLRTEGHVTLAYVDSATRRPMRCPQFVAELIKDHF